jgi:hypothetical protein
LIEFPAFSGSLAASRHAAGANGLAARAAK